MHTTTTLAPSIKMAQLRRLGLGQCSENVTRETHCESAPVDWILAKMTELGEAPAALHLGLRAMLGAVAIRGESDGPSRPPRVRAEPEPII